MEHSITLACLEVLDKGGHYGIGGKYAKLADIADELCFLVQETERDERDT